MDEIADATPTPEVGVHAARLVTLVMVMLIQAVALGLASTRQFMGTIVSSSVFMFMNCWQDASWFLFWRFWLSSSWRLTSTWDIS